MSKQPHRAALPAPRRAVTTVRDMSDKSSLSGDSDGLGRRLSAAHGCSQESGDKEKEGVAKGEQTVTRSIPRQTKTSKESKT